MMVNKYGRKLTIHGTQRFPKPIFARPEQALRAIRQMLALPIKSVNTRTPWGYETDPKDPSIFIPIEEDFKLLWKALEYIETCSYDETADWLGRHSNRSITGQGLWKIFRDRRPSKEILEPIEVREKIYQELVSQIH